MYSEKDVIKSSEGNELLGKRIVLCITGSVAAYRAIDLARKLMRHGADVFPVMSRDATKIVHPHALEWATGCQPVVDITGKVEHVRLIERCDLVLVAPATANTIAKVASGIADTSVTLVLSVAMGAGVPIVIVPAMHEQMYQNPILMDALNKLKGFNNVYIMEPKVEEAKAKFPDIDDIAYKVFEVLYPKDLKGYNFIVTAGPTLEYIDPVRVITNKSSGKMGVFLAEEAHLRGASVTAVLGRIKVQKPRVGKTLSVETTDEMLNTILSEVRSGKYHAFISAAAPVDYRPIEGYSAKLNSREVRELSLSLRATPKIVNEVRREAKNIFIVAFKAEYKLTDEELIEKAVKYAIENDVDLVVANDVARVGVGFEVDTNEVFIVDKGGLIEHVPLMPKKGIASKIIDVVAKKLRER